jgi:hypothetical protein
VFCAASGDSAPLASEDFFSFPFIEDFIDQQTPAEHKHRVLSRCAGRSLRRAAASHAALTHSRSSVVTADRTLKPDSQVLHFIANFTQNSSHLHCKLVTCASLF